MFPQVKNVFLYRRANFYVSYQSYEHCHCHWCNSNYIMDSYFTSGSRVPHRTSSQFHFRRCHPGPGFRCHRSCSFPWRIFPSHFHHVLCSSWQTWLLPSVPHKWRSELPESQQQQPSVLYMRCPRCDRFFLCVKRANCVKNCQERIKIIKIIFFLGEKMVLT